MNSKQKQVRLQFFDMRSLWQFAQQLTSKSIEINTTTKTLLCDCSEAEIQLAKTNHGAEISNTFFSISASQS